MTIQLEKMVSDARKLSMPEKLELLQKLTTDLQEAYSFSEATIHFWNPQTPDRAIRMAPDATDIRALAVDFWPQDETADQINAFVAAQRQAALLQEM